MGRGQFTDAEIENAKSATYLDEMDMIQSPNGGHLVPVAMKHGVHVCWQCGDPFDPSTPGLRGVEKLTARGATVPVLVHAKCVAGPPIKSFFSTVSGLGTRRSLAKAAKASMGLIDAARDGAKKIIGG